MGTGEVVRAALRGDLSPCRESGSSKPPSVRGGHRKTLCEREGVAPRRRRGRLRRRRAIRGRPYRTQNPRIVPTEKTQKKHHKQPKKKPPKKPTRARKQNRSPAQ